MTDGEPASPPPGALVHAEELEVRYGRGAQAAVSGVSLTLGPGDGLLLCGPAGSGKTSVLRGLLGLAPRSGAAWVLDRPPGDPRALRRVGYAPQRRPFARGWLAREVVELVARLRELERPAGAAAEACARAGLEVTETRVGTLEIEDARRLALACALAGDPPLLVLDDPWEFPETRLQIELARERGAAVLAASGDPGGLPALLGRTLALAEGSPA